MELALAEKTACDSLASNFIDSEAYEAFVKKSVEDLKSRGKSLEGARALDLSCGSGRLALGLAEAGCSKVVASDAAGPETAAFQTLLRGGIVSVSLQIEGEIFEKREVTWKKPSRDRVSFVEIRVAEEETAGVIEKLRTASGGDGYDVVTLFCGMEKSRDPKALVEVARSLVRQGGTLFIGYTGAWNDRIAPASKWVGGVGAGGPTVGAALESRLSPMGRCEESGWDLEVVVRDTARKTSVAVVRVETFVKAEGAYTNGVKTGGEEDVTMSGAGEAGTETLQWKEEGEKVAMYERTAMVQVYLDMHFSPETLLGVENFPKACARECGDLARELLLDSSGGPRGGLRVLELGGGVGRFAFEAARWASEVWGSDYSEAFVKAARGVKETGVAEWGVVKAGGLREEKRACLKEDLGIGEAERERVKDFIRVDATKLDLPPSLLEETKTEAGAFDLIFGGNLIDRLPDPLSFLQKVGGMLKKDGLLVLSSPYTWLSDMTPREKWIGGREVDGKAIRTESALRDLLLKEGGDARGPRCFVEARPPKNIAFVIRESERTFQRTQSQRTVWQKTQ
uniref:Methyltransferase domain-containing protein n=1 Tax=Chromera velia CCMP2878 TaxID=1169474 RepID=A0A0G4GA84_9ALVE|eukprot:Cvel_20971.t1-p1 / transcript=Cvel_20971.t1 / gene=Cvel_20971 / organism=Chromera_velia_CCMP2878 / gene_product=hypothetical protein / transcript_product=hypothetical protein / location=Cvel_scaffold1928:17094-22682(-) / protein_length=567 / sequence_SO=supercontig / SO=protein_coding / is_pseudo=false